MNSRKSKINFSFCQLISFLLMFSCVALTSCKELLPSEKKYRINASEGLLVGKKSWTSCQIKWQVVSTNTEYNKYVTSAFGEFSTTGTFITFSNQAPANITVGFAPSSQIVKTVTEGVLQYNSPTLSVISQPTKYQYRITINQDYSWSAAQLQYVVMHQIATILGISPNQNITQKHLLPTPILKLSDAELGQLRAMYPASGLPALKTGQVIIASSSRASVIEATVTNTNVVPQVLSIGHCWSSKSLTPTLNDNEGFSGDGLLKNTQLNSVGTLSSLYDLKANTKYYIRAYARNDCGIGYGEVVIYTKP